MTLAIGVRFPEPIEPLSREEGIVPGAVEDAGFDRKATLVSGDRTEIIVTLGTDNAHGDLDKLREDLRSSYYGLRSVSLVDVDTDEYHRSAALAAKKVEA